MAATSRQPGQQSRETPGVFTHIHTYIHSLTHTHMHTYTHTHTCTHTHTHTRALHAGLTYQFEQWFTWCQSCRHGGHAQHMVDWFR